MQKTINKKNIVVSLIFIILMTVFFVVATLVVKAD